jgi:hypothetical protein
MDRREVLHVHAGRLLPQLPQLGDRGIPFCFLLGSFGLAPNTVQLGRGRGDGPGTRGAARAGAATPSAK